MYTIFVHLRNVLKIKYLNESCMFLSFYIFFKLILFFIVKEFECFTKDFDLLFKKEEIEEAEKCFRLARISFEN